VMLVGLALRSVAQSLVAKAQAAFSLHVDSHRFGSMARHVRTGDAPKQARVYKMRERSDSERKSVKHTFIDFARTVLRRES
jgi:hypothetical protein